MNRGNSDDTNASTPVSTTISANMTTSSDASVGPTRIVSVPVRSMGRRRRRVQQRSRERAYDGSGCQLHARLLATMIDEVRVGLTASTSTAYSRMATTPPTSLPSTASPAFSKSRATRAAIFRHRRPLAAGIGEWLVSERYLQYVPASENLTKIYGSHTFKGGFEGQLIKFPGLRLLFARRFQLRRQLHLFSRICTIAAPAACRCC